MNDDATGPSMPTDHPETADPAGMLLIVSGPSGVGKTTITHAILDQLHAVFSVSVTTRAKTDADTDGVDYYFLTDDEFQQRIDTGGLLEWAEVFGRRYGTPREPVEQQLADGKLVLLEIDVEGAKQVKAAMPDTFGLFILPPCEETLLQRLRDRKRESEERIQARYAEARREIAEAKSSGVYDAMIVNDDLDRAIAEACDVVRTARARRSTRR
jgi:guanylate kinase